MMSRLSPLALASAVLVLPACSDDAIGGEGDGIEFRQIDPIFDDLGIHEGNNTDSPECLIWEVTNSNVEEKGTFIMSLHDDRIDDADGIPVCERQSQELVDVVTPSGEDVVLFTVLGRWVFDGELDFRGKGRGQILKMLSDQLMYTIKHDHVYDGLARKGNELVTGTERFNKLSTMGKLSLAALVAGECGSSGVEAFQDDDT